MAVVTMMPMVVVVLKVRHRRKRVLTRLFRVGRIGIACRCFLGVGSMCFLFMVGKSGTFTVLESSTKEDPEDGFPL